MGGGSAAERIAENRVVRKGSFDECIVGGEGVRFGDHGGPATGMERFAYQWQWKIEEAIFNGGLAEDDGYSKGRKIIPRRFFAFRLHSSLHTD